MKNMRKLFIGKVLDSFRVAARLRTFPAHAHPVAQSSKDARQGWGNRLLVERVAEQSSDDVLSEKGKARRSAPLFANL
jgi:hypothetical protein